MIQLLIGLVVGNALTIAAYERTITIIRAELNSQRANEQLLLTRLASRTPAEFHAVTGPLPVPPAPDGGHFLHDVLGTGLFSEHIADAEST